MQRKAAIVHMILIALFVAFLFHISLVIRNNAIEFEVDITPTKTGYIIYSSGPQPFCHQGPVLL